MSDRMQGHFAATFTALVWGCTFVSSKYLLEEFNSIEILITRFLIAFIVLLIMNPHIIKVTSLKQELCFAGAGISGCTLYYMLENLALTYTQASNVSVITCTAPFFTALLVCLILKEEKMSKFFVIGFVLAIAGICLISFNGSNISLDFTGMVLAIVAAFTWGIYSVFIKKIEPYGFSTLLITQRLFFYGLVGMIPYLFFMDYHVTFSRLANPVYIVNFLYLGVVAGAVCFVTWNFSIKKLGAVASSVYIYLIPVVTVAASLVLLHEVITPMMGVGIVLTLSGLIISELKPKKKV